MTPAAALLGGRYRLEEPIGTGGYCEVWRAADTVLARPVAVKLLHPGYAHQAEALARFQAEARHAGSFSHPNIARVYDYGEPVGRQQSYLVMELVEGPSLAVVLSGGPLDAARTMDVIAQSAAGLQAAHSTRLIHRDIKPANILFAPGGMVKITDFGLAHAIGAARPCSMPGISRSWMNAPPASFDGRSSRGTLRPMCAPGGVKAIAPVTGRFQSTCAATCQ